MLSDPSNEVVLYAPISQDTRFVEFKIQHKTHDAPASSWSLVRTVVDQVPEELRGYVAGFPLGAQYQEKTPAFLRNLTIIDSRAPGTSRFMQKHGDVYFDLLSPLLRELGVGHVYVATSSSTSIAENAASFSSSGTVVIIGGDTSAHEFINALQPCRPTAGNEMRLVIVPTGTGNALATSVGHDSPVSAVQRLFLAKSTDFVPLSTFPVVIPGAEPATRHALVVASWGFHASLVADSDSQEMRERFRDNPNMRFREAAKQNLETVLQKYDGNVLGGVDLGPAFSYLLFTTVTHLEQKFCISPSSHPPSSNELYAIAIPPFDDIVSQKSQLMDIMLEAYDGGRHIKNPLVTYRALSSEVVVSVHDQPASMRRWCIDGQTLQVDNGEVRIQLPSHRCRGWLLKILPG